MQALLAAIFGVVLAGLANFGALVDFQACVSDTHCNAFTVCQDNQVLQGANGFRLHGVVRAAGST